MSLGKKETCLCVCTRSRMETLQIQKHQEGEERDKNDFVESGQINLINWSSVIKPFPPPGGSLGLKDKTAGQWVFHKLDDWMIQFKSSKLLNPRRNNNRIFDKGDQSHFPSSSEIMTTNSLRRQQLHSSTEDPVDRFVL